MLAESQRLNNKLHTDKRDDSKVEQKKNVKGQVVLSTETNVLNNEQFAWKHGNS